MGHAVKNVEILFIFYTMSVSSIDTIIIDKCISRIEVLGIDLPKKNKNFNLSTSTFDRDTNTENSLIKNYIFPFVRFPPNNRDSERFNYNGLCLKLKEKKLQPTGH